MLKSCVTPIVVAAVLSVAAPSAEADIESLLVEGLVTDVNDSPFAGGATTMGISPGDMLTGTLSYDDTTGQPSGDLVSFELTALAITVPDTTQVGNSFDLIPAGLSSATRIVFDASDDFVGLSLPNNVTGLEGFAAFGLTGVDFESSGFIGPEFRFNLGVPVVEGVFSVMSIPAVPSMGPLGHGALVALLLASFVGRAAMMRRRDHQPPR
jgi:hypothetical protein